MRLGTTSYIFPADITDNVRRLAGSVDDIELVIFESPAYGDNYPDKRTIKELVRIAADHDLTYTVHLPLDLRLGEDYGALDTAARVIYRTRDLSPHGYVVHLDGTARAGSDKMARWLENAVNSLEVLAAEAGGLEWLCAENLDDQPAEMMNLLLDRISVSCCVDVGHLWKQGLDPVPCLQGWLPRARVVHIHGVGTRDHKGLSLMSPEQLDPVVGLLAERFQGVITFEVFNERDFMDCRSAFAESKARIANRGWHQ